MARGAARGQRLALAALRSLGAPLPGRAAATGSTLTALFEVYRRQCGNPVGQAAAPGLDAHSQSLPEAGGAASKAKH